MTSPGSGTSIDPSIQFAPVTPSDTAVLLYHGSPRRTKGIFVGTAGTLTVKDQDGTSVLFTGCLGGVVYPISTQQITSSGTSATNLVALF